MLHESRRPRNLICASDKSILNISTIAAFVDKIAILSVAKSANAVFLLMESGKSTILANKLLLLTISFTLLRPNQVLRNASRPEAYLEIMNRNLDKQVIKCKNYIDF